jgi:hypothetical protein
MSSSANGDTQFPIRTLPVTGNLTLFYALSLLVALLIALASLAGLLDPQRLYPTEDLRESFLATDVLNLLIGLPILLGALGSARRGKLLGLLLWPGALFYVLYHAIVYVFALPLNLAFLLWLLLLVLSVYTLAGLVARIDGPALRGRLAGAVPERAAGGVLAGLGTLFALLALGTLVSGLAGPTPIAGAELALQVADFTLSPAWIIGGLLLWRRAPLGYVTGLGLLFQASMLFVGLIAFLLLQPLLTGAPFAPLDVVVTFILGLICFIPLGRFLRGVVSKGERL